MSSITTGKTKRQLEKEIEKLRAQIVKLENKPYQAIDRRPKKIASVIRAAEFLPKHQMVVVDKETHLAYAHPNTAIIANKRKLHGRVVGEYKQGEAVSIKPWWEELEDEEETV